MGIYLFLKNTDNLVSKYPLKISSSVTPAVNAIKTINAG